MSVYVDYEKLEGAAKTIDEYVAKQMYSMARADTEAALLSTTWQGQDSALFQLRWKELLAKGSTSQQMIAAMQNYAKFLRAAAGKYKQAQTKAWYRASTLK